jgi:hypothetical protein
MILGTEVFDDAVVYGWADIDFIVDLADCSVDYKENISIRINLWLSGNLLSTSS